MDQIPTYRFVSWGIEIKGDSTIAVGIAIGLMR